MPQKASLCPSLGRGSISSSGFGNHYITILGSLRTLLEPCSEELHFCLQGGESSQLRNASFPSLVAASHHTAVDWQNRSCDPGALIRCKEKDGAGDVTRLTNPAQRMKRIERRQNLRDIFCCQER